MIDMCVHVLACTLYNVHLCSICPHVAEPQTNAWDLWVSRRRLVKMDEGYVPDLWQHGCWWNMWKKDDKQLFFGGSIVLENYILCSGESEIRSYHPGTFFFGSARCVNFVAKTAKIWRRMTGDIGSWMKKHQESRVVHTKAVIEQFHFKSWWNIYWYSLYVSANLG